MFLVILPSEYILSLNYKRAYGAVYRAVHLETDMVLAIKELPNLVNQEELKKEIDILKKVS